jgi:hypothetical protein
MVNVVDRITVPFAGEGHGEDELSWEQLDIWIAMERQHTWMPLSAAMPLPAGTTVEDVVDDLRYLMNRYQSMRTRVRFTDDGRPRQVLFASGEVVLDVVDARDDDDPSRVAQDACRRYGDIPFDFVTDWPVRIAVVRHRGVPTQLAVTMCHLVVDGSGAVVMWSELTSRKGGPVNGMQPLEQVRWQRSPAGRRQNEMALRYWDRLLRSIPAAGPATAADSRQPRYWSGLFRSPALSLAVRALAERTRDDSATVLMTAYAIALAQVRKVNPVVFRPVVSNRFRPGLAEVVCPVAQASLYVLTIDDFRFDETLPRARRAVMNAYKNAYVSRTDLDEAIAVVRSERGADLDGDLNSFYNDRRLTTRDVEAPVPTPQHIRDALPHTTFHWTAAQDDPFAHLFVHIDDVPDTTQITIEFDTHYLSPDDAEALVRQMEAVAVDSCIP